MRILFLLGFIAIAMASCSKEQDATTGGNTLVETQLAQSQKTLSLIPAGLTLISWAPEGKAVDKDNRAEIISTICHEQFVSGMAQKNADGNFSASDFALQTPDAAMQANFKGYLDTLAQIGAVTYKLKWSFNGQVFETSALANEKGILWDNVLTNVLILKPTQVGVPSVSKASSPKTFPYWKGCSWLWGSDRGEMYYNMTIYYNTSTRAVTNTDLTVGGYMSVGRVSTQGQKLRTTGSFGQVQVALGMSTPTVSLTFRRSNFTVTASGVGSNFIHNATKSLYP